MKHPKGQLQELVSRLQQASGDNLLSVVLYGSAAREEFDEQLSDVNLLIVFRKLDAAALTALAPVMAWWTHEHKLSPPLIMTDEELRDSADVFAIELLDIQHRHNTLFGEDMVSALTVPMNLHRVEVEHELRTTLLRLRQHRLLAADKPDELRWVMAKSLSSVLTLFRHALIAVGETPPHGKPQLLEHAAQIFGFDAGPLRAVLELRRDAQHSLDVPETYHAYMNAVARVARELDRRAPKQQWQKLS